MSDFCYNSQQVILYSIFQTLHSSQAQLYLFLECSQSSIIIALPINFVTSCFCKIDYFCLYGSFDADFVTQNNQSQICNYGIFVIFSDKCEWHNLVKYLRPAFYFGHLCWQILYKTFDMCQNAKVHCYTQETKNTKFA